MSILNAIILGLVQGIAEFLPISSSGHLSVLQTLFHMSTTEQGHLFFDVLLHFGTLISVFIVYWQDIVDMVREFFLGIADLFRRGGSRQEAPPPARRMILLIIIGTLPLFLILPIKDTVESLYSSTVFIGFGEFLTQVFHVGVFVAVAFRFAQADAVDDRSVVELIGDDRIFFTQQGLEQTAVGIEAGRI